MKKFISAVLLFALSIGVAFAQQPSAPPKMMGTLPNKAGGKILFMLDASNPNCNRVAQQYPVTGYSDEGQTLDGCWYFINDDYVRVRWEHGESAVFPTKAIEMTDEFAIWLYEVEQAEKAEARKTGA